MTKCLTVLLVLGLAGCSGAPLVSSGLSSDPGAGPVADYGEPAPAAAPRAAQRRVAVQRVRHPAVTTGTAKVETNEGEEPYDRAARAMDRDVQRLENAARQATSSICRGC